jgi:hypothetical protein
VIIYLNGKSVSLRKGMKVKHALSTRQLGAVRAGRLDVVDSHGNIVGLEGSLTEGARLYTRKREPSHRD